MTTPNDDEWECHYQHRCHCRLVGCRCCRHISTSFPIVASMLSSLKAQSHSICLLPFLLLHLFSTFWSFNHNWPKPSFSKQSKVKPEKAKVESYERAEVWQATPKWDKNNNELIFETHYTYKHEGKLTRFAMIQKVVSTMERQEGWIILRIVICRLTQMNVFGSSRWNSKITTT